MKLELSTQFVSSPASWPSKHPWAGPGPGGLPREIRARGHGSGNNFREPLCPRHVGRRSSSRSSARAEWRLPPCRSTSFLSLHGPGSHPPSHLRRGRRLGRTVDPPRPTCSHPLQEQGTRVFSRRLSLPLLLHDRLCFHPASGALRVSVVGSQHRVLERAVPVSDRLL